MKYFPPTTPALSGMHAIMPIKNEQLSTEHAQFTFSVLPFDPTRGEEEPTAKGEKKVTEFINREKKKIAISVA